MVSENLPAADDDSWSDVMCSYPSQPIHLWQFLRELLLKPHNYSRCIRWLNKEKGEPHQCTNVKTVTSYATGLFTAKAPNVLRSFYRPLHVFQYLETHIASLLYALPRVF